MLRTRRNELLGVLLAYAAALFACTSDKAPGPTPCDLDADCPPGQVCHEGFCRIECLTSIDCEQGMECVSGVCLTPCDSNGDCAAGEVCRDGYCRGDVSPVDGGLDGGGRVCLDADGDGYGEGADCLGRDCDDADADIHPGAAERCGDDRDNDCDGATDEACACSPGSSRLCSSAGDPAALTAEMVCLPGIQLCVDGEWDAECLGEVPPRAEVCNGLDDDCDGQVDEGLRNAVGECQGEVPPEDCGPTGEGNGLDDDGDGQVDEDCSCLAPDYDPALPRRDQPCYSGPIYTLGVGICHGGTHDCLADGTWGPCEGEVLPAPEDICGDELDNDCDGFVDETCPDCRDPVDEVCDGRDNDCDGVIDEDVTNACGLCGDLPAEDICGDGLDNDCDGTIDEGCGGCVGTESRPCYPGPESIAGVGACQMGSQTCNGEFWGVCSGYVLPRPELCGPDGTGDGIDDDCDGQADESCGCPEGQTRLCGQAAGECRYGHETCSAGQWVPCLGGQGPGVEVCDGQDNDCDGLVDEGLLNACGTCGESCYLLPVDPTHQGQGDDGVDVLPGDDPTNPTGRTGLSLTQSSFIPPYLWAANHEQDSVSKFNTDTHVEEGRYWVGDNPSRTAVDLDGNMWVGGRDDGRLTKVIWDTGACPDRNGNLQVDTSTNQGSGAVQLNSAADPFADECVVYSAVPNSARLSIRGVAAAPDGKIWIGYTGGGVQSIDPQTFQLGTFYPGDAVPMWAPDANGVQQPVAGQSVSTGGVYGLVVDSRGLLYTSRTDSLRNTLACFDTTTEQWVAVYHGLCGSYGICVDGYNRIWFGSYPHCGGVNMFDPDERRFYTFAVPSSGVGPTPGQTATAAVLSGDVYNQVHEGGAWGGGTGSFMTTGVGVEPATGDVWTSFYPLGYTGRLRVDEGDYSRSTWTFIGTTRDANNAFLSGVTADLRGVGFDRNGFAWTLGLGSDRVWKLDPATNLRHADLPLGMSIGPGTHYTYSDFTGSTALSFTAPRGFWIYLFDSEYDDAQVDAIVWEAYSPAGTSAGVRIRALNGSGTPISGWLPPDNLGVPAYFEYPEDASQSRVDLHAQGGPLTGHSFDVEIRLTTNDRDIRPIVFDVRLEWQRP